MFGNRVGKDGREWRIYLHGKGTRITEAMRDCKSKIVAKARVGLRWVGWVESETYSFIVKVEKLLSTTFMIRRANRHVLILYLNY